jgi:hypothetical protein
LAIASVIKKRFPEWIVATALPLLHLLIAAVRQAFRLVRKKPPVSKETGGFSLLAVASLEAV